MLFLTNALYDYGARNMSVALMPPSNSIETAVVSSKKASDVNIKCAHWRFITGYVLVCIYLIIHSGSLKIIVTVMDYFQKV